MHEQIFNLPSWAFTSLVILSTIGYLIICFMGWYFLTSVGYALRSGRLSRGRWTLAFECFREIAPCYLPGGQKHRIRWANQQLHSSNGHLFGIKRNWNYQEAVEQDLFEDIFYDFNGGHFSFWFTHGLAFILGPAVIAFILVWLIAGAVLTFVVIPSISLFGRLRTIRQRRGKQTITV